MEDVLEDERAQTEDEGDHRAFHATTYTHYHTIPVGAMQVPFLTDGISVRDTPTGSGTWTSRCLVAPLTTTVLPQLRMHRTPKKPHLAVLYREARALADDAVLSWAHHYRELSKMADHPANIAMDTCTSIHVHATTHGDIIRRIEERMNQVVARYGDRRECRPQDDGARTRHSVTTT